MNPADINDDTGPVGDEVGQQSPTSAHAYGYTRLADFMAYDKPTAIFSRFNSLNALNLLNLQAEVCALQEELGFQIRQGEKDESEYRRLQYDWTALHSDQPGAEERRKLFSNLRDKLTEYNSALTQQVTLYNQPSPSGSDLDHLHHWLTDLFHGASELRGPGSDVWSRKTGDEYKVEDLISIWPRQGSSDSFTKSFFEMASWWTRCLLRMPQIKIKVPLHDRTVSIDDKADKHQKRSFPGRVPSWLPPGSIEPEDFVNYSSVPIIVRMADSIATVLCCLVITIPIVILNYMKDSNFRLLVIVLSTLLFSFCLASTTDASRKDIFAVTAAFTAVQIVFIGSA